MKKKQQNMVQEARPGIIGMIGLMAPEETAFWPRTMQGKKVAMTLIVMFPKQSKSPFLKFPILVDLLLWFF